MPLLTIVGMGAGVSTAIAERFGSEGFTIAMIARNADKLAGYQVALRQKGIQSASFPTPIADWRALDASFAEIQAMLGMTHVLVFNAAAIHHTPALEESPDVLLEDFKVNVICGFRAAQLVFPAMQAVGKGTILFTGGGLALHPRQAYTALSLGKAALRNLTYSLAEAAQGTGIHVATVTINGFINPQDAKYNPTLIAEQYWQLYQQSPADFQTEIHY